MAKYSIYAIGYGIDPATQQPVYGLKVPTWKECESFVKGVDGAKFKGFLTDTEADAWIAQTVSKLNTGNVQQEAKPSRTISAPKNTDMSNVEMIRSRFVDICMNCGVKPNDMVNQLIKNFVDTYDFTHSAAIPKSLDDICPFDED